MIDPNYPEGVTEEDIDSIGDSGWPIGFEPFEKKEYGSIEEVIEE